MTSPRRLIVGVTGSSAPQLAWTLLEATRALPEISTHLVISKNADNCIEAEMAVIRKEFEALADVRSAPSHRRQDPRSVRRRS